MRTINDCALIPHLEPSRPVDTGKSAGNGFGVNINLCSADCCNGKSGILFLIVTTQSNWRPIVRFTYELKWRFAFGASHANDFLRIWSLRYFDLVPIERNKPRLEVLKKLIKRAEVTEIINACDAGREGELIFRNTMRWTGAKKPTRRLWLQSMTLDAIREGFAHLRSEQEMQPLADAALSRAESDWLVGINATRALTSFNSRTGGFQNPKHFVALE